MLKTTVLVHNSPLIPTSIGGGNFAQKNIRFRPVGAILVFKGESSYSFMPKI